MLLFQQKDYAAAAVHLEKAIAQGLEDARLHNFLGICYSRTGRFREAIANYGAALKSDPALADAHLNLAFALLHERKPSQAHTEYQTACRLETKYCQFVPKLQH